MVDSYFIELLFIYQTGRHYNIKSKIMKAFLFISILMLFYSIAHTQTSQEEYNFITKGYRFTIDYGLDMKKGYSIKSLKKYELSSACTSSISGLFRNKSGNLAGYLVKIKDGTFEKDICIPTERSTDDIWKQYDYMLQSLPIATQRYVTVTLSRFLSQKPSLQNTKKYFADSTTAEMIPVNSEEEGTGGIVIPKKTNPLLPSNVEGINHHTIRFFPDSPQTAKEINGFLKLRICVNKEGDVMDATILNKKSSITNNDVIILVLANVRKYKFSLNVYAPDIECGYITYTFTKISQDDK
jgi:hypothetical protein